MVSLFHRNRPDDGLQAGTRSMMGPRRRRGRAKAEVGRWLERLEDRTLLATVRLGAGDVDNLTPPAEPTSDVLVPNQNRDTSTDPYTVTTTSDSGTGSLRQAILNADAAASGPITIRFQIPTSDPNFVDDDSGLPGGDSDPDVFVIQPLSALPALHNANASIVIDGTTQTAFTGETNPFGPEVVLDGTSAGAVNGLTITSNDNVIIGLDIRDFVGAGSGVLISGGASNRVSGCYIGVDATGTSVAANGGGVIVNSAGQYNIVGTDGDGRNDAAEGNLISGNFTNVLFSGPGTDYNVAAGNLVGTDRTGEVALANPSDDVGMNQGASFNRIGTNSDGVSDDLERNVIVGAHFGAITVYNDDTDGNLIAGNYVGVDITGTVAMGSGFGIGFGYSYGGIGAAGTQIVGNVISGNGTGIVSDTATHGTRIAGNLIGTNAAGTAALGNGTGIAIYGFDNVVGGATAAARNVVSGNNGSGILISGAAGTGNFVAGNFIGTTQDGTAALGNVSAGVIIASGARDNVIGTNGDGIGDAAEANLISGNALHGVEIYDSQQNLVAGNDIGTDATGMVALANAGNGVQLDTGASNNTIGGVTADERNVISGNGSNGIWINGTDPDDNVIQGNYIGLNAAGTAAIGNLATGVLIDAGSGNEVGGNVPGARNVISGNGANGVAIRFAGTTQDVVQGNFIGTDAAGSAALANRSRGVFISGGAHHNVIGTDGDGANDGDEGNVISGNGLVGVFITDSGTTDNVVAGNFIGTNAAGTAALGNGGAAGVRITGGAQRNRIGTNGDGSSDDLERNIISGNTGNGIQIDGANTRQNVVAGNSIGVNRDGTASLGNGGSGVVINSGAQSNIIGTNGDGSGDGAEGNVISGNASFGIWIDGAQTQNTVIAGNFIGTDANGTAALANGTHGIDISNGASGTRIGTNADGVSDQAERNVISGNAFSGISLDLATTGVVVAGNYIGTDKAGMNSLPNGTAGWAAVILSRGSFGNRIGSNGDGVRDDVERNLISGNHLDGISITGAGSNNNVVAGNDIGTDLTGTAALGNGGNGVSISSGASGNTIGGLTAMPGTGLGNVISGNSQRGVRIRDAGTASNVVAGNIIGLDSTGTVVVPNAFQGVEVGSAGTGNVIGGTVTVARNIISGNGGGFGGVFLSGTSATLVAGNDIGTDLSGTLARGNSFDGIQLGYGATHNTIGGTAGNAGNVISGNGLAGIRITVSGTEDNLVAGNFLGTTADGTASLGNLQQGVLIQDAAHNSIGGAAGSYRNVISGNLGDGVRITGTGASGNVVEGNFIGTDKTGTAALANGGDGVRISDTAQNNLIGGDAAGQGNTIAFNAGNGVTVVGDLSTGNAIRGNAIFSNGKLGIDLGDDGVTLNDSSGHAGPNLFQDFPVLSSAITTNGATTLTGSLSGIANTTYRLEFFSNPRSDPSGYGQGQTSLMVADVTTDGSGTASFSVPTPSPVAPGQVITATATDPAGNTSEFSAGVVNTPLFVTAIAPVDPNPRNTAVSTIDVTLSEPVNPGTFDYHDLNLTDNGGANLITSAVTVSLLSGSTYRMSGLAGLTTAEGNYILTVSAAGILDLAGVPGTGSLSTTWLMDTTPPASHVNALPTRGSSLSFTVSVTGSDPNGAGGSPPSGTVAYDIFTSTNGGPWFRWTTVPASSPTVTFTGQSNTTYGFYSIAHDLAGNTESKRPLIEASTYLPDLTPPVTSVNGTTGPNPSTVDHGTGTFTLNVTGIDSGGSGLAYFEVFVAIDAQVPVPIGPAIPAGTPDNSGTYHATTSYQGLADGVTHQYRFSSIGIDGAGNPEAAHPAPNDVIFAETFAQPSALAVTAFTVEHGAAERSYIRYLDIGFNESDSQSGGQLTQIAGSVGSANPEIQLYKYDLNGTPASKKAVPLGSPVNVAVLDHAIELDFGANGIGEVTGSNNTIAADGYYELDVLLPNNTTAVHHFYRLLGDVTGDGVVDNGDLNAVAAAIGQSTPPGITPLNADANGDGSVTAFDMTLVTRSRGRKLGSGLPLG